MSKVGKQRVVIFLVHPSKMLNVAVVAGKLEMDPVSPWFHK